MKNEKNKEGGFVERSCPRISAESVARLVFSDSSEVPVKMVKEGSCISGSLMDISVKGAGFLCEGIVGTGTKCALMIDFCDKKIACEVSVKHLRFVCGRTYVGVEFMDLDPDYKTYISAILSNINE